DPELYWRFNDASGPAQDSAAFGLRPGVYNSGAERGAPGVLPENTAVRASGNPDGTVATANQLSPPSVSTAAPCFKSSTSSRGQLVALENSQTGNCGTHRTRLHTTNGGRVVWGSWIGSGAGVTGPESYNDGVRHPVATVIDHTGR